ncbi:hypothetical protein [Xanthomonas arboricola]|uniref:hypothetical protein n=1 Tax=Xanthomonas arboricola TaxID=56448 RepID=UPI0011AF7EEE|nr:hypothetical protein [Xanthomonas arboricola]
MDHSHTLQFHAIHTRLTAIATRWRPLKSGRSHPDVLDTAHPDSEDKHRVVETEASALTQMTSSLSAHGKVSNYSRT